MLTPKVLYEDNHLLVLNKPSGWLVQRDKTGDKTLTDWGRDYIKEKYQKPGEAFLHPTHRLDRPVSGITIFARTSKGLERMNKLFRDDDIQKSYLAVTAGLPPDGSGKLIHWVKKDGKKNLAKAYNKEGSGAKRAELDYKLLGNEQHESLIMVMPKTGRAHQIRVQLASMKTMIKGDLKYGYPTPNPDKSIHLHAFKVSFVHPVRKEPLIIKCHPDWTEFKQIVNELD